MSDRTLRSTCRDLESPRFLALLKRALKDRFDVGKALGKYMTIIQDVQTVRDGKKGGVCYVAKARFYGPNANVVIEIMADVLETISDVDSPDGCFRANDDVDFAIDQRLGLSFFYEGYGTPCIVPAIQEIE